MYMYIFIYMYIYIFIAGKCRHPVNWLPQFRGKKRRKAAKKQREIAETKPYQRKNSASAIFGCALIEIYIFIYII